MKVVVTRHPGIPAILGAGVIGFVLACRPAPTEPGPLVTVTVVEHATNISGNFEAKLELLVANDRAEPIYIHPCSTELWLEDGTARRSVWGAACLLLTPGDPLAGAYVVRAGETRSVAMRIEAPILPDSWPATGLSGQYRLSLGISDGNLRSIGGRNLTSPFEFVAVASSSTAR